MEVVNTALIPVHAMQQMRPHVGLLQFCEWYRPVDRNAERVVRSLAFQLATRPHDHRKLMLVLPEIAEVDRKEAAKRFDFIIGTPSR